MNILITNDDGYKSVLLKPLIDFFSSAHNVTIVVPKEEQSWRGKSMSRDGHLQLDEIQLFGKKAWTFSGTPADCVNVGIHTVCQQKPDLLIAGINGGHNTGHGFVWSSGTVGASFEANISGVPGIAYSQYLEPETFNVFRSSHTLPEKDYERLEKQAEKILIETWRYCLNKAGFLGSHKTLNINFPWIVNEPLELRDTNIGTMRYGGVFKKSDQGYSHGLDHSKFHRVEHPQADFIALKDGAVSISCIDLSVFEAK